MSSRFLLWYLTLMILLTSPALYAQWQPGGGIDEAGCHDVVVLDSTLFMVNDNGIFARHLNGEQWEQKLSSISFSHIMSAGEVLFASAINYIYRSTDHGNTWTRIDTPAWGFSGNFINVISIDTTLIFSIPYNIYRSDDYGNTIYPIGGNIGNVTFPQVFASGGVLFCVSDSPQPGIHQSFNKGIAWDSIPPTGLPSTLNYPVICKHNNTLWFSEGNAGIFYFNDAQQIWVHTQDSQIFFGMESYNGVLYGYSWSGGFFRLNTSNNQFISENSGLETNWVEGFTGDGSTLYLATNVGPYQCTAPFLWQGYYDGLNQANIVMSAFNGEDVWIRSGRGVFVSSDHGAHFTHRELVGVPLPTQVVLTDSVYYMIADDSVYLSRDEGFSWQKIVSGLPYATQFPFLLVQVLAIKDDFLFLGTSKGLYRAAHDDFTWHIVPALGERDIQGIALHDTVILAIKHKATSGNHYYTFRSGNNGASFDSLSVFADYPIPVIRSDGDEFFSLVSYRLFNSLDGGLTWPQLPMEYTNVTGRGLAVKSPVLLVSGVRWESNPYGLYLSITYNKGVTWTSILG
ncbi:MAG: hypothetical protein WCK09_21895, partial [Bacteroidota bacterium]